MKKKGRNIVGIILGIIVFISFTVNDAFAEIRLDYGWRKDEVNWNIGGNGVDLPNILSELTWTDLEIRELKVTIEEPINENYFAHGAVGYGWIISGKNQDSDWFGNSRTNEFSRSNNSADDGHVADISLGIGRYLHKHERNSTALLAGYAWNNQNLVMTDGNQIVSFDETLMPLGPLTD